MPVTVVANSQHNPEFAAAIQAGGPTFREMVELQEQRMREATEEKVKQEELLNADPYDIEVGGVIPL